MAQKSAVVRANLVSAAGSTNFTSSGFGTPTAAIIICCDANTTNNPQSSAGVAIGFWDGTSIRSCAVTATAGLGTTSTVRASDDGSFCLATPTRTEYTIANTTDGITITMSVDNTGVGRQCTVILLAGVSAKAFTFTPNATQNLTATSASIGFAPKLALFITIGISSADTATANAAILTFGFARQSDGQHRAAHFGSLTGVGTSVVNQLYSETRCTGQAYSDTVSWGGEITTWGADDFTMTTRDGGSGSDVVFCLALGGADLSFDSGTLTTPTATGNSPTTTTIPPETLLLFQTQNSTTALSTTSDGLCIGISDGTNQYLHNITEGDGIGTSNNQSQSSASAIIDVNIESSGFVDFLDATVDSFNATDFTLNFSQVDGTARLGWWLAFGAAAGGSTVPIFAHHYRTLARA